MKAEKGKKMNGDIDFPQFCPWGNILSLWWWFPSWSCLGGLPSDTCLVSTSPQDSGTLNHLWFCLCIQCVILFLPPFPGIFLGQTNISRERMTPIAHVNILVFLDSNFFFWGGVLFYTPYRNILVTFNFQRLVILELYIILGLFFGDSHKSKEKKKSRASRCKAL